MYAQAIMGEEELEQAPSTFWSSLGSVSKSLLSTGSQIYAMETQKDIEGTRLQTARLQQAPTLSTMLKPSGIGIAQPASSFPVLPIALGAGVLSIAYLLLTKKKGRR